MRAVIVEKIDGLRVRFQEVGQQSRCGTHSTLPPGACSFCIPCLGATAILQSWNPSSFSRRTVGGESGFSGFY
ncbi:hypothetical protein Y032_0437g1448 [Ancylostoma ceylanicum]|uniref:Uncharacterized protein n=1 Tax=Ancylostoma ceylanicum TaxID=53326 RepID=A0A016WZ88_9BILA|nr:hypothetical protein Y032_0437g1448 [Ancylostoma ceylanicum]